MIITLNDELKYQPPTEYQETRWNEQRASGHKDFAEGFAREKSLRDFSGVMGTVVRGLRDHQRTQTGFINVLHSLRTKGDVVSPADSPNRHQH